MRPPKFLCYGSPMPLFAKVWISVLLAECVAMFIWVFNRACAP